MYSWHILITPDDGQNEDIQNAAIELCEYMEDAIYIADPPQGLSRDGVINWHNGASQQRTTALQSNYCCTYWPWVKVYNAIESKYQYVMPSIVMAAQFCKVDNNYGPWYAPAGATNGYCSTVLDLEVNSKDKRYPNKIDRDNLYLDQNRINPFLKLRNGNILAYGEKEFNSYKDSYKTYVDCFEERVKFCNQRIYFPTNSCRKYQQDQK